MTSIVRQLEAAIMSALEDALDGAALVTGFRQSVADGTVKTADGDGRPEVRVSVQPAASASYASPVLEFSVSAAVSVQWSDDPAIATFDEACAAVESLLMRWNLMEGRIEMKEALATENFRCDGFRLAGGTDAFYDGTVKSVSTTFNFAVKGVFINSTQEDE